MSKGRKVLFRMLFLLMSIILIYSLLLFHAHYRSPKEEFINYDTNNPFITNKTLIAAHRLGLRDDSEESMIAIESSLLAGADILELDIHLTKDKSLILLHDKTFDRTTDNKDSLCPEDLYLEQIKSFNIISSSAESLKVLTLDEVFDYCENKDVKYIIEIKSKGEEGKEALDILYKKLVERNLLDRVIFGTFDNEVTEYCTKSYPDIIRSASIKEALEFYIAALINKKDYEPPCSVLQIFYGKPYYKFGVNLATSRVINYAHKHNMAIQYWTVNEDDEINYLLDSKADCIITDNVKRATELRDKLLN